MSVDGSQPALPTIGITMGDPDGIGPEVLIKALADPLLRRSARFVIYGLNETLTFTADAIGRQPFWFRVQHDSDRGDRRMGESVIVRDFDELTHRHTQREPTRAGGLASKAFVEAAITDAMRSPDDPRYLNAVVTAPISKHAWRLAGFNWPGHTELFAHRTRARQYGMMFVSPRLRVMLATCHIPLLTIRDALTIGRVFDAIDLAHQGCQRLGIAQPRIAVTGLNPHAGENGLLGDEDGRIIAPAIDVAQRHHIPATGPHPADTVFIAAAAGEYDVVVAMYHDQGLIPVKLLGWDKAVNWTVGLPIIRTSPDHGTAFDIAGRNKASSGSMRAAIDLALQLNGVTVPDPPSPANGVHPLIPDPHRAHIPV